MSLYTAFIENILVLFGVIMSNIHCICSPFFEISSQVSEKASKVRFLYDKPEELQNHSNEEIGKEKKNKQRWEGKEEKRKKAMVVLLVFIIVPLAGARPAFRL